MVALTLSSKGQLVIPKDVRKALGLKPGNRLHAKVSGNQLILEPAQVLSAKELRGILAGTDALRDLEQEHHLEVAEDEKGS